MTSLMYVIHKTPDLATGGTELHTWDLMMGLLKIGTFSSIDLVFPSDKALHHRRYSPVGMQEVQYPGGCTTPNRFSDTAVQKAFSTILQNARPSVIHFQHLNNLPVRLIQLAAESGARTVVTFHDFFLWCPEYTLLTTSDEGMLHFCGCESRPDVCAECLNRKEHPSTPERIHLRRTYINSILRMVDRYVFPSQFLCDTFIGLYPNIDRRRCAVIPNGIEKPADIQPQRRDTHKPLVVAMLGHCVTIKGRTHFVRLAARLRNDPRFRFIILGETPEGLPSTCKRVKAIGRYTRDNLGVKLAEEDVDIILLLSPWAETFSYTLSEAVVHGVPVICTDLGAFRERVRELGVGPLVDAQNPVPKIASLLEDFAEHPAALNYFRDRCAAAASEITGIADMVQNYVHLYESLEDDSQASAGMPATDYICSISQLS